MGFCHSQAARKIYEKDFLDQFSVFCFFVFKMFSFLTEIACLPESNFSFQPLTQSNAQFQGQSLLILLLQISPDRGDFIWIMKQPILLRILLT